MSTSSEPIAIDRCAFGHHARCPVKLLCSPNLLLDADPLTSLSQFATSLGQCTHSTHELAPGDTSGDDSLQLEPELCSAIARALYAVPLQHNENVASQIRSRGIAATPEYTPFSSTYGNTPLEAHTAAQREHDALQEALTAAQARPRRDASSASYARDGSLVGALFDSPSDAACFADVTAMIARADEMIGITVHGAGGDGASFSPLVDCTRHEYLSTLLVEMSTGDTFTQHSIFTISGADITQTVLDDERRGTYHCPKHEHDFLKSPDRAIWHTAKELKMDEYNALHMFNLVPRSKALSQGLPVMGSLWAYAIKYDADGKFIKLAPRWCIMGGDMPRDKYEAYSDVCRFVVIKVLMCIRATYRTKSGKTLLDWLNDLKDAFQSTRTDREGDTSTALFCEQAPGFKKRDVDGLALICEILVAHQGRIDSARLCGQNVHKLLVAVGCRTLIWAPKVYLFHSGALALTSASLSEVLEAAELEPATKGAPAGWAIFGQHVDDHTGLATSQPVIDYLLGAFQVEYACKCTNWKKVLGFTVTVCDFESYSTVSISCMPVVEAAVRTHILAKGELLVNLKHPYSMAIKSIGPGVSPPSGSPELRVFEEMQTQCRSLLGLLIWVSEAYPQIKYPVNYACAYMANPSEEVYKVAKHALMHLYHHPTVVTWGGPGCTTLETTAAASPLSLDAPSYLLHQFTDSNLDMPSITGGVQMLAGGVIEALSSRQHIVAPDAHTAEVVAAGTCLHRMMAIRGLLQELRIYHTVPSPLYIDSASTVFIAKDVGGTKRAVWTLRRAAVLLEAVGEDIDAVKIGEADMVADGLTKAIKHTVWLRHPN
jgi:hypothetical protein